MSGIEQRFLDEAARQLIEEDDRRFMGRVRERAIKLQGESQRLAGTDFPTEPAAVRAKVAELQARQAALLAKRPIDRSAADDAELDGLVLRLGEMGKRLRQLDRIEGVAA